MVETSPGETAWLALPLLTERSYGDTMVRIYGGER